MESKKRPREAADDGENGDESRRSEPRRTSIPEVADDASNKRLLMAPESFSPRAVMQEELRNSSVNYAPRAPRYRLQFQNDLPDKLYTFDKIMAKDKNKIQISMFDTTTQKIVTTGPLSSVKIKVLVLCGDFCDDGKKIWTDKEFNKHIVIEREGQGPLLRGKLKIQLKNGVGYLDDITFSDNSSRTRSKNFSLAVRIDGIEGAQEGISQPFRVMDRRGKCYKKHHPPLLTDEVWRLEKIRKGGPSHAKLEREGILNVEQFLCKLSNNEENLRNLLSGGKSTKKGIPNRTWDAIVANAKESLSVAVKRHDDTIGGCNAPREAVDERMRQNKPLPGGSEGRLLEEYEVNDFITEHMQPNITMIIVATSSRKWFKLSAGLKVWIHCRAARRAKS